MISLKITVKNDHRSMTEGFECKELYLTSGPQTDSSLLKWIEQCLAHFNAEEGEPVEEVIIKLKLIV